MERAVSRQSVRRSSRATPLALCPPYFRPSGIATDWDGPCNSNFTRFAQILAPISATGRRHDDAANYCSALYHPNIHRYVSFAATHVAFPQIALICI